MHAVVIKLVIVEPQLIQNDEKCGETETQNISDSLIKGIILMDLWLEEEWNDRLWWASVQGT